MSSTIEANVAQPTPTPGTPFSGEARRQVKGLLGHAIVAPALVLSDVVLATAVWEMIFAVQQVFGHGRLSIVSVVGFFPFVVAWVGLRALSGLYPGYGMGQVEELRRQTLALLTTLAITAVFVLASHAEDTLSRLMLFGCSFGLLLAAPMARYGVKYLLMRMGAWGKPVVVLGAHESGARVLRALRREWQLGFKPIGVFDNHLAPAEGEIEGVPYGGTLTDAINAAKERGTETAIFAMPYVRRERLARLVSLFEDTFRHIVVIPNLDGITNSAVVARDFAGTFGVEVEHNLLNPWAQRLKRTLDLVATLVGGIFALPLIAALSLLVWAESGGSIFYADQRLGRDGKLFPCIKFRTMVPDAEDALRRLLKENAAAREEYMRYHKLRDDPRVTRIGRFLRKTSLDELPQLWNVIRGDMSLVGPRPYLPRESEDIGAIQVEILRVLPGITGPWQVSGRNGTTFAQRVNMDARYVRDWSVWLDIVLLFRTVWCLMTRSEAY